MSEAVVEPSLLRLNPDEKLTQVSIILNSTLTSPKTVILLPTRNYVDSKFDDPSIKKTQIMLISMIKFLITLAGLKYTTCLQLKNI